MRLLTCLVLLFLCQTGFLFAQNLVPNGDFESHNGPWVTEWQQPPPPFYHYEMRGKNHINGICMWPFNESEYMQVRLSHPLEAGKKYLLSMRIYPTDPRLKRAEAVLSLKPFKVKDKTEIIMPASVDLLFPKNRLPMTWFSVQKEYIARGGEEFLVLGAFFHSKSVSRKKFISRAEKEKDKWKAQRLTSVEKNIAAKWPPLPPGLNEKNLNTQPAQVREQFEKMHAQYADSLLKITQQEKNMEDSIQTAAAGIGEKRYQLRTYFDDICLTEINESGNCQCKLPDEPQKPESIFEKGIPYRLEEIRFQTDKSIIEKESFPELGRLASMLKEKSSIEIRILGHTDSSGDENQNKILSVERAKALAAWLVEKGIKPERILVDGLGSSHPVESNQTPEGREKNRRVEFVIIKE